MANLSQVNSLFGNFLSSTRPRPTKLKRFFCRGNASVGGKGGRGSHKKKTHRKGRRRPSSEGSEKGKSSITSGTIQKRVDPPKKTIQASVADSGSTISGRSNDALQRIQQWIAPARYRSMVSFYTREEAVAMAQRLPLWLILVVLFSLEEMSPYGLIRVKGPSMLPTIAPDGSDLWLRTSGTVWRRGFLRPSYQVGDLVGFSHPDYPNRIACKRIIGVAGDRVQRYGQYVHLFLRHDPDHWGIVWPDHQRQDDDNDDDDEPSDHAWIDPESSWDQDRTLRNRRQEEEPRRTLVVPAGHVWLEADCPGLGLDSRHYGPIPVEWIRGKLVARLWPLWRSQSNPLLEGYQKRPHPIPLDEESLRRFNVHRIETKKV